MTFVCYVFFFFSSRRRHTRSLCDWSSDVCSSDLLIIDIDNRTIPINAQGQIDGIDPAIKPMLSREWMVASEHRIKRSEERRVGKGVDLGGGRIMKREKRK